MIIYGTHADDITPDTENDDFIFGRAGDDTFLYYFGNDFIFGGQGDDIFIVSPQVDAIVYINGGRGDDTLVLARDPISVDHIGNKMIIHYDYDMVIITERVDELSI